MGVGLCGEPLCIGNWVQLFRFQLWFLVLPARGVWHVLSLHLSSLFMSLPVLSKMGCSSRRWCIAVGVSQVCCSPLVVCKVIVIAVIGVNVMANVVMIIVMILMKAVRLWKWHWWWWCNRRWGWWKQWQLQRQRTYVRLYDMQNDEWKSNEKTRNSAEAAWIQSDKSAFKNANMCDTTHTCKDNKNVKQTAIGDNTTADVDACLHAASVMIAFVIAGQKMKLQRVRLHR